MIDDAARGRGQRGVEGTYSELEALYAVAGLASAESEPERVVDSVLRVVEDAIPCERALLFVFREEVDELHMRSSSLGNDVRVHPSDAGVVGRIWVNQAAEIVNDLRTDPDAATDAPILSEARQIAASPLKAGDAPLGVVAAVNSRRGGFDDEDLRVLSILGDRIALTLQNSGLMETLQRQVRELEGLQELSKLLTSGDATERVVGESIRIVSDLLSCEKIAVLLHDEESNSLTPQPPVHGIGAEELGGLNITLDEPSLAATVFRTNTALASNDARNDAWVNARLRDLLGMDNVLIAPLTTGARPIGVLKAINTEKGYFDKEDIAFVALLGRQVAAILESNQSRQREQALMRRLKEADRTKTEFVSMLAHELKGPMTTILGFANTLKEQRAKLPVDKQDHILSIVSKEVERLSRLVNDLLDVSRMEAGSLRYDLEPMSIFDVVDSVLTVHTSLRSEHGVISDVPESFPKVLGDKDRIRQVVINLLTNAARYSPAGSDVTITARLSDDGKTARVAVADRGIGVPEADRERIFEKFAMLPKPGWVKKGTGLGLFITKGIIEAHGGRIWVEQGSPNGSVFVFTLPVATDEASA